MAARTRRTTLNEKWRQKIRASMLVHRLQKHATSDVIVKPVLELDENGQKRETTARRLALEHEMTDSQIRAAEILLRKVAPDLQKTTVEGGDADKPLRIAREMSDEELEALAATGKQPNKRPAVKQVKSRVKKK